MIAKHIGLADWRISNLVTEEYYCPAVAKLTRESLCRITALADIVSGSDPDDAGAIMNPLCSRGL